MTARCPYCWVFIFEFDSRHAGYGDRTGQALAQVITPHRAAIGVEQGEITSAVMDEKWDMIRQEELGSGVDRGSVVIWREADFLGWITDIQPLRTVGMKGQILVETDRADTTSDKYMVTIADETLILKQDGEGWHQVGFDGLKTNQEVQIWFSGPVKESYPAQVGAKQIVIGGGTRQTGILEGRVTIGPIQPVVRPGDSPTVPPEVYEARKMMVYNENGSKLVEVVDLGEEGSYGVELRPGIYTIDINHLGIDRSGDVPKKVEIRQGETVELNIDIDTGIR